MNNQPQSIKFLLNQRVCEAEITDSNLTLLNFIRSNLHLFGTKEGCAEGDCGACSVVLVEQKDNKPVYRLINSCLYLTPLLDGKQLITIEQLSQQSGQKITLHPCQQKLLESAGTQCGFCTPGFVMALFAMYHQQKTADLHNIKNYIAGNLCRCTGYQSILAGALQIFADKQPDLFDQQWPQTQSLLDAIEPKHSKLFEGKFGRFFVPRNESDLADYFLQYPEQPTYLNGGTDIGLWITKQHRQLTNLVYLGQMPELSAVIIEKDWITIGGNVTVENFLTVIQPFYPNLITVLERFASKQIRSVATVAGNLSNASPIGDLCPILLAMGAQVSYGEPGQEKIKVGLESFFLDYRKTLLQEKDIIFQMHIPKPRSNTYCNAFKVSKRFDQDISALSMAIKFEQTQQGLMENLQIAYGGLASTPKRSTNLEAHLNNKHYSFLYKENLHQLLQKDFQPISDMRASANYRLEVAANLLTKQGHLCAENLNS